MSTKQVFGGVVVLILLGLYVYLVWGAIAVANGCGAKADCSGNINEMTSSAMALIGGLVSALVIAVLALTKPGETPSASIGFDSGTHPRADLVITIITITYLVVWLSTGLAAFVVGLKNPTAVKQLTTLGQGWLGLAVAAGYASLV